jgi:hypothetical protein
MEISEYNPGSKFGARMFGGPAGGNPDFSTVRKFGITSKKPKSSPLDFVGNRTVQGEVTQNVPFDRRLDKVRKETSGFTKLRKLGVVTNSEQVWIRENQLLFRPTDHRSVSGVTIMPARNEPPASLCCFSQFDGMITDPMQFPTQHHFNDAFEFVGIAKSNIPIGRPEIDGNFVAVAVAGGMTIPNDGRTEFMPGDIIRAELPPIDDDERQGKLRVSKFSGPVPTVGRPTITKEDPSHMREMPAAQMELYLNRFGAGRTGERDAFLQRQPNRDPFPLNDLTPAQEFFASEFIHGTATDAWLAVMRLAQIGVISINLPAAPSAANTRDLSGLAQLTLEGLRQSAYGPLSATGALSPIADAGDRTTARTELWNQGRVLAALLGLQPDDTVQQAGALRDILLRTRAAGLITKKTHESHRSAADITRVGPERNIEAPSQYEKDIWRMQHNRAVEGMENFYTVYRMNAKFRIGKAISHGRVGGTVDILM